METISTLWAAGKDLVLEYPGAALILAGITVLRWAFNTLAFLIGF